MELYGWQQCQRKPVAQCTGTLSLLPPSWDTVSAIYSQVLKLVSKFPGQQRLVLYFAYKGATVKLDLGDVKAAGAVCILGLGIGLGTLFVYRLYHRYIRPFLDVIQCPDPEKSKCSDCSFLQDSSNSGVDGPKGDNSDKQLPALLDCVQYGVAFGGKAQPAHQQTQTVVDSVRLRRKGTRTKPMRICRTEVDNRYAGSTLLSPVLCDVDVRDSFYSTAESGFETLPECNEEEEEEEDDVQEKVLLTRETISVPSGKEKIESYLSSSGGERTDSSPSGIKTVVDVTAVDDEKSSDPVLTGLRERVVHTAKSSPARKAGRSPSAHLLPDRKHNSYPHSLDLDYDPSLDASESIQSFNSSGEGWSWEEEEKETGPLPPDHTAMTDSQFRQSLMQRIHEWSALAEEHRRSRSPTPDFVPPLQNRQLRRSHSLDRHLGEPLFIPDVDVSSPEQVEDLTTIKNLECLETEFHDIQDEFESITSRLHDLIERGSSEGRGHRSPARPSPSTLPHHLYHPPHRNSHERGRAHTRQCSGRTRWECMPSTRDSSRVSRASSVEFSWDLGELGGSRGATEGQDGGSPARVTGPDGDCRQSKSEQAEGSCPDTGTNGDKNTIASVADAISIHDYAEQEWRGDTQKARTIKQGYAAIPDLFQCQRLRQIRGDNYCALRSALFQVLAGGHKVTRNWPGPIALIDQLEALYKDAASGLDRWVFAGRPPWALDDNKFNKIVFCALSLFTTIEEVSLVTSQEERTERTMAVLNENYQFETELMEGLKLMMLFYANELHGKMREGADVPTFAYLLFARDTSSDLVSFVQNHLNCMGDTAGLDQVEMCLLAHCLGIRIRVAHLQQHGQDDFECSFPDMVPDSWPSICLVTEDGRHYNVPVH